MGTLLLMGSGLGAIGGTVPFPSLSGLLARWRADVGVTTSGGNVTQVLDQVNGFTLTNSGTVPFNATGFNGKPTFDFLAANDAALFNADLGIGTGNTGSAFFIGQMSASTTNFGGGIVYSPDGSTDFSDNGGAAWITRNGTNNSIDTTQATVSRGTTAVTTGANHRFGAIFDSVNLTQYIDNVAGGTGADNHNWLSNGNIVIGNRYLSGVIGGNAWQGPISEIVICTSALSATERNNLDAYFVSQWGA